VEHQRRVDRGQLARRVGAPDGDGMREVELDPGVVDALVAAEALRWVPSIVITSDPSDLRRLCDADPSVGGRVAIWRS
jgi:hypothetical protein